jgi:hypothetical protein
MYYYYYYYYYVLEYLAKNVAHKIKSCTSQKPDTSACTLLFHPKFSLLQVLTLAVKYYSRFHGRKDTKLSYLGRVFVTPLLFLYQ